MSKKKKPPIKEAATLVGAAGLPAVIGGEVGLAMGGGAIAVGFLPMLIIGGCVGFCVGAAIEASRDQ